MPHFAKTNEEEETFQEETSTKELSFLLNLGLALSFIPAVKRLEFLQVFQNFYQLSPQEFKRRIFDFRHPQNLEELGLIQREIDKEVERQFSDRNLTRQRKKGEISEEEYQRALERRFQEKGYLEVGKGRWKKRVSFEEHQRRREALTLAQTVQQTVKNAALPAQINQVISVFGLNPQEARSFTENFLRWQRDNPQQSFENFLQKSGFRFLRTKSPNGRKMKKGEFEEKKEKILSDSQTLFQETLREHREIILKEHEVIEEIFDLQKPLLTTEEFQERIKYVFSSQKSKTSLLQEKKARLAVLKGKPGFLLRAEELWEMKNLEREIAQLEKPPSPPEEKPTPPPQAPPSPTSELAKWEKELANLKAKPGFLLSASEKAQIKVLEEKISRAKTILPPSSSLTPKSPFSSFFTKTKEVLTKQADFLRKIARFGSFFREKIGKFFQSFGKKIFAKFFSKGLGLALKGALAAIPGIGTAAAAVLTILQVTGLDQIIIKGLIIILLIVIFLPFFFLLFFSSPGNIISGRTIKEPLNVEKAQSWQEFERKALIFPQTQNQNWFSFEKKLFPEK